MSKLLHIPTGIIIENINKQTWEKLSKIVFKSNIGYYTPKMNKLFPGDSEERDRMRYILTSLERKKIISVACSFNINFNELRKIALLEEFEIIYD